LNELVSAGSISFRALEILVLVTFMGIQNGSMSTLQRQVSLIQVFSTEYLVSTAYLQLFSTEIGHGSSVETTRSLLDMMPLGLRRLHEVDSVR